MSNKDLSQAVNTFMLNNAPTLTEATPMAYDLLKVLATRLLFDIKTTKEHAMYVMARKYRHIYATAVITTIISEAFADELSDRLRIGKKRRENKRLQLATSMQPVLLMA